MDIQSLYNIGANNVISRQNVNKVRELDEVGTLSMLGEEKSDASEMFSKLLSSAVNSIQTTNGYLSDAENEEIKLALGETQNAHDLTIALSKASLALQYTVAIRDRFLEAYKEIMQINV